jgi:tRNA-modifying protein YgfZ
MDFQGYYESQTGAAYFRLNGSGLLYIQGPDRKDFLQRQTTADLNKLQRGQVMLSVLTSPTARILDVPGFYIPAGHGPEDAIAAVTLPGYAETTARFLKSRIFFNDNVKVIDGTEEYEQWLIIGPEAGQVLEKIGAKRIPEQGTAVNFVIEGEEWDLLRLPERFELGYRIIFPKILGERLQAVLAECSAVELVENAYEVLRIEAGLPSAGKELIDAYTPLETGLDFAVSDAKGCYTGQEVIARQLTYDKVTRYLTGIRLDSPVEPGASIEAEGRPAGVITSSAQSPRYGTIALGIVRRAHHEPGTRLTILAGDRKITGEVQGLPFSQ